MHTAISYADLDLVSGELLPERAVMSTVMTPVTGGTEAHIEEDGWAMFACQSTKTDGTPGLVGSLGLGSNNPSNSLTCVPAAIAND